MKKLYKKVQSKLGEKNKLVEKVFQLEKINDKNNDTLFELEKENKNLTMELEQSNLKCQILQEKIDSIDITDHLQCVLDEIENFYHCSLCVEPYVEGMSKFSLFGCTCRAKRSLCGRCLQKFRDTTDTVKCPWCRHDWGVEGSNFYSFLEDTSIVSKMKEIPKQATHLVKELEEIFGMGFSSSEKMKDEQQKIDMELKKLKTSKKHLEIEVKLLERKVRYLLDKRRQGRQRTKVRILYRRNDNLSPKTEAEHDIVEEDTKRNDVDLGTPRTNLWKRVWSELQEVDDEVCRYVNKRGMEKK